VEVYSWENDQTKYIVDCPLNWQRRFVAFVEGEGGDNANDSRGGTIFGDFNV